MHLCIRKDILSSLLNSDVSVERFFVELNLRKKKWLLCCFYNPHKNEIPTHLKEVERNIDVFSSNYNNSILLGDSSVKPTEQPMKDICLVYNCKNIISDETCYENPENPKYIDLIMTNMPNFFPNSQAIETGLSDFSTPNKKPHIIQYQSYTQF